MAFGVTSDPFSYTDTYVEIQSRNVNPEGSEAQCEDSRGDIVESTIYGEFSPVEATYKVCRTGSFDSATKIGDVKGSYVITSIAATRNNKDALSVTVMGVPTSIFGDTATIPTYTPVWPTGYMAGGLGSLEAGISLSAGRSISSSITFAAENVKVPDSVGDFKCVGLFAGRMEATNEVQSCDTEPAASAASGWTLAAGNGAIADGNTEYQTATFGAFRNIIQD